MSTPDRPTASPEDEQRVPLFGSWRAIHAAVVVWALIVLALLFAFSRWPF